MESKLLASAGIVSALSLTRIGPDMILQLVSGLNPIELLVLAISGSVLIGHTSFGSRKKLPFYLIKCPKHGYQLSYPTGFDQILLCPKCIETDK